MLIDVKVIREDLGFESNNAVKQWAQWLNGDYFWTLRVYEHLKISKYNVKRSKAKQNQPRQPS